VALLIHSQTDDAAWKDVLGKLLPDDELRTWPDTGDRADIEFIVMFTLSNEELATFPNLRGILLLSAGVNHLRPVEGLPDVPIVRMADQAVARDMATFTLSWIIHVHRAMHRYGAFQREHRWERLEHRPVEQYTVGILGLGNIGRKVADYALAAGYPVRGWSRSRKDHLGVDEFIGPDELDAFLSGTDCLVNVLPLTPATRKIVDADRLSKLPEGAAFINIGRGGSVDDDALCTALDGGRLDVAVLDVFRGEPLEPESPLWDQPGIIVTPHMSGWSDPVSAAPYMVENIARIRAGAEPFPLMDRSAGY
jgi:glyoxylate/hydroxypyruvate reductase A